GRELESRNPVDRGEDDPDCGGIGGFGAQIDITFEMESAWVGVVIRARTAIAIEAAGADDLAVIELAEVRRARIARLAPAHAQPVYRLPNPRQLPGGQVVLELLS